MTINVDGNLEMLKNIMYAENIMFGILLHAVVKMVNI